MSSVSIQTDAAMKSSVSTQTDAVALDGIYDPEQWKLMEERCIVVDDQDRVLGAADKKTCELN